MVVQLDGGRAKYEIQIGFGVRVRTSISDYDFTKTKVICIFFEEVRRKE